VRVLLSAPRHRLALRSRVATAGREGRSDGILRTLRDDVRYDVSAHDPATYVAVLVVMAVVLLIAAYIPARRAMRIEAIVALRSE
jgi:hypothetical protein